MVKQIFVAVLLLFILVCVISCVFDDVMRREYSKGHYYDLPTWQRKYIYKWIFIDGHDLYRSFYEFDTDCRSDYSIADHIDAISKHNLMCGSADSARKDYSVNIKATIRDKYIRECAIQDSETKDKLYNKGMYILRESNYSAVSTNDAARYYVMCNNL